MKIIQVLPSLAAGGAEGFVTNLCVHFAQKGNKVRLFLLGGVRGERGCRLFEYLQDAGVVVLGREERKPASLRNLLRLAQMFARWRPDIVQANLYPSEIACAMAKLLNMGCRSIFIRRLANTELCAYRSPWAVKQIDRFFPVVIACSDAVANAYYSLMQGQHRARLEVIPNGGQLLQSIPNIWDKRKARHALDLPQDAFVITHIGRMFPGGKALLGGLDTGQKAHDILLRSFSIAFSEDPKSRLLLVGDGPLRSQAEDLAEQLGISEKVQFLGQLPEPWPALLAADVFFFPSRYEGLPNVLPEAASCGLPVIASDIPEIRSLCPQNAAWLLVPVNSETLFSQALRHVRLEIETFVQRAHAAAPDFVDRFSMELCAERYLAVYRSVLSQETNCTSSYE